METVHLEESAQALSQRAKKGELLALRVPDHDVYNITVPVSIAGETYIFGRVEQRKREDDSRIFAFRLLKDGTWLPIELSLPSLQDPAISVVDGLVILSGIYVQWAVDQNGKQFAQKYWTVFYTLDSNLHPTPQGRGPDEMKDIRLLGLHDGRLLVFGRPQRQHRVEAAGGRISVSLFPGLSHYDSDVVHNAPILPLHIPENEWVGANHAIEVDGMVWVLGHVGRWVEIGGKRVRQYDAMIFVYDPTTNRCSSVKIIVKADDFDCDQEKNEELGHIIFSGGFEISADQQRICVYVGLNDAAAGKISVDNFFPALVEELRQAA